MYLYMINISTYLPRAVHVPGKLCVFDEVSLVDALLHGLSGCEVVVCKTTTTTCTKGRND